MAEMEKSRTGSEPGKSGKRRRRRRRDLNETENGYQAVNPFGGEMNDFVIPAVVLTVLVLIVLALLFSDYSPATIDYNAM